MRIAFTGTQSTGKTTLLNQLCRVRADFVPVRGVARSVIARGYPLGKRATCDSYALFIASQLEHELQSPSDTQPHFVSDRCMLDLLAHANVNQSISAKLSEPFIQMLDRTSQLSCRSYEHFFYFPIEFGQQNDGIREEDEPYRAKVSEEILRLMRYFALPHTTVSGTVATRLATVQRIVSSIEDRQMTISEPCWRGENK